MSLIHGLYWLTANLADSEPLLLVVDDAHWADIPSLRFMHYLARRLDGLRVVLLVAARPAERGHPTRRRVHDAGGPGGLRQPAAQQPQPRRGRARS